MGWRGTVRSVTAAVRAADREAERSRKIALKSRIAKDASQAVVELDEYLDNLISVHTDIASAVNWHSMASLPPPQPHAPPLTNQTRTASALARFKPSIFDKLRGGSAKRRAKLEDEHRDAINRDKAAFELLTTEYQLKVQDWQTDTSLAHRLINGEVAAINEVLSEMRTFTAEYRIGSHISFTIREGFIHAKPEVHKSDIVPRIRRKQLASGNLSETRLPDSQFNELYQDYVSSVALRVAGDIFSIIPISEVYVTCLAPMLDLATGYEEKTPVLSVLFVRDTFSRLNLAALDPSDSMSNFKHQMRFKKTKGFERVVPLQPIEDI